ncbi:MAG: thioesterase domain-containing protein, partial [Cyanobacteria bacterium J06573_2]
TIQQLAELVSQEEIYKNTVIKINPNGSKSPLFIVANNGYLYQQMIDNLDKEQPVYIIQEDLDNVPNMASRCLQKIREIQPDDSYNLMGHSYEGLVAYEIAQQIYAQNGTVSFLGMLDTPTPEIENRAEEAKLWYKRYQRLKVVLGFSWKDKTSFFKERIEYKMTQSFKPLIQNLREFMNDYEVKPFPGKIHIFLAEYEFFSLEDANVGWDKWAAYGVEVHKIPGTHRSMLLSPDNAKMLAAKLTNCLTK